MQANVTTSADVRTARVRRVRRGSFGGMTTHFVATDHD
jgi:hypothetical protein